MVFVLDESGSMEQEQTDARAFVRAELGTLSTSGYEGTLAQYSGGLAPGSRVSIVSFSTDSRLLQDWTTDMDVASKGLSPDPPRYHGRAPLDAIQR